MKKKVLIIISIIAMILVILVGVLIFTSLGAEIRGTLYYNITTPKEMVTIEEQEHVKVTYTYNWQGESFDIDVTDKDLIEMINDSIVNKKLENYSGQIGLAILGQYTVDLGDNLYFKFDGYDKEGFVMLHKEEKEFLTKIDPNILNRVVDIVDIKLTENVQMFKTEKITITNKEDKQVNIERKTAIEYILNQCKNIYTKEMNYEPNMVKPDYIIDFNSGIQIFNYNKADKGFLLKDKILYEVYGIGVLDSILENTFDNIEEKEKMFTADKITITSPNRAIEVTDKEIIERITTPMIFSTMQQPEWINNYKITEEYNNGIKIRINEYEFLIPGEIGTVTIGNRYIISNDKKIKLCFPLQDIEKYVNELLEK